MFAANTYRIRFADQEDVDTLERFAALDSGRPFVGRVLIGYLDGVPAAALSVRDGRAVADPSRHTGHLVANLRARAAGIRAYEQTPSLRERLLAGIPASFRARMSGASASMSHGSCVAHEPVRVADSEQEAGYSERGPQAARLVPA
jgi:hypothetical protein